MDGILYEDDALIVVHKKAGVPVQTRSVAGEDMESLLRKYRRMKKDRTDYIGIVHRLDQPVEGLLVFAKTPEAAAALSEQFRDRQEESGEAAADGKKESGVRGRSLAAAGGKQKAADAKKAVGAGKRNNPVRNTERIAEAEGNSEAAVDAETAVTAGKEYRAVVFGRMPDGKGRLVDYLVKDARTNTSRVTENRNEGKRSVLDYEVLSEDKECQTLRITLRTGRHHQIRVQLSHAGCPILGDTKYGTEASECCGRARQIRQLQLFADRLCFRHPVSAETMEFALKARETG